MKAISLPSQDRQCVSILKGVSIILVILIHTDLRKRIPVCTSFFDVYSEIVNRLFVINAVPVFFFLSGYLFYLNEGTLWSKWKKRIKTVLLPFFCWCIIGFLIPFFFQKIIGLKSLYTGGQLKYISDFTPLDYLRMFWDLRDGEPILPTMWFMRNLICLILLAPIFRYLSLKLKWFFPALLFIYYIVDRFGPLVLSPADIFWYGMGIWLCTYYSGEGIQLIRKIDIRFVIPVWIILFALSIAAYCCEFHYNTVRLLFSIVHSVLLIKVVSYSVSCCKLSFLSKIAGASFFIYAFHEPWISYIISFFYKYINVPMWSNYLMPFIFAVVAVLMSYAVYLAMRKVTPHLLNILTGSRE